MIDKLLSLGWYRLTQVAFEDTLFEGELSVAGGDFLLHPCVQHQGQQLTGFGQFFWEDYFPGLFETGLAVDLEDPDYSRVELGSREAVEYTAFCC